MLFAVAVSGEGLGLGDGLAAETAAILGGRESWRCYERENKSNKFFQNDFLLWLAIGLTNGTRRDHDRWRPNDQACAESRRLLSTEEKSPSGFSYPDFLDCKKNATLFESFQFR